MSDFTGLPDLAVRTLGGGVVYASDEFFEAADNLVTAAAPTFTPHTFGAKGQVYDGWETRRRRDPGAARGGDGRPGEDEYDQAIVRLGVPGVIRGIVIDTAFFTGNYPPYASVDACTVDGHPAPDELAGADWSTIVERSPLAGDTANAFDVEDERRFTHVRLRVYPDGGVARLRVHGEVRPDPRLLAAGPIDLAALEHGGRVVACSDRFYGTPSNLIMPGLARVMGEGWETRRRRVAGHDWVLVRLAAPGRIRWAELDTTHFKGNAPAAAALRGIFAATDEPGSDEPGSDAPMPAGEWIDLLPRTRIQPDTRHRYFVDSAPVVTHVRLDIFPDGGMARLRLFGEASALSARPGPG